MKKNCKLLTILMMAVFAFTGCNQNPEEEVVLKGITLDTTNVKTEFTVGDEFTTDGLVVTATYSDETTKTVDGWTPTGNDLSKPAESQEITITYAEGEVEVSASYTIVVKEKTSGGESGKEPPATPKIALSFNTKIESYSLVKIFDVIYLSDKSNANYKDYSVCKDSVISDSVLQLKVNDYDESYALTINDKAVTVTEGKVAFQDILKNTIVGKNTIKILKGEETIDTAEFTVETGYFDCSSPALKIVTKEGSSAEVGESHIIKAGENLRYGVKAGTSSKIEFEVVQEDGKAYPAEIKTSFKVENATVEKNLVTINGKNKNTYEVKVSIEVPEEYKKPGAAFSGTASFTTKYDIETGYVKVEEVASRDYRLEYSNDGKSFETISESQSEPIYCFDEYGDIYFHMEDASTNEVKKYSVNTKEYKTIFEDKYIQALSYDYDNSVLYLHYYDDGYKLLTLGGETQKEYSISELNYYMKFFAVKNNDIYFVYKYEDTNTLYKYTMNISDTEIKLENEQKYAFPANVKTISGGNVDVNDMILLDDDIYLAVGIGWDIITDDSVFVTSLNNNIDSRGCILKFNITSSKFDVLRLDNTCNTIKLPTLYAHYSYYGNRLKREKDQYTQFYYDSKKTSPVTADIVFNFYVPKQDDSNSFGYITGFAAIKPKKLVCTQNRNFVYLDDTDEIHNKFVNAYSSIDLCDFAISDYTKLGTESDFIDIFSSCGEIQLFDKEEEVYYDCGSMKVKDFKLIY